MKNFAAYYAGVYTYDYTNKWFHPWFPSYNPDFAKYFNDNVNLDEWEGVTGQPAKSVGKITYDSFTTFDQRQADNAVDYIKRHAGGDQPFFMDVNFLKMHNPTNASPDFAGRSHLGDYSDSLMELDATSARSWTPSGRWHPIQSSL
jgi:Sulfatase